MVKSTGPVAVAAMGLVSRSVFRPHCPLNDSYRPDGRGDMAVIPKEPLEWLGLFRQQMDEIFRYLSTLEGREGFNEKECSPLVDIYETAASFVVEVELPGCEAKDITLSVCCSILVVEGVAREEAGPGVNYICLERCAGRFCRAVEIPPEADLNGVRARYLRGLLTVTFPWSRNSKMHIREIPIE